MSLQKLLSNLAFWRDRTADCGCPESPGGDPAFSAALTALGAKLARADGRTDVVEFEGFMEAFPTEPEAERDVRRLYTLAGETVLGFESYARRIGKRYSNCPKLLEKVVLGLFHVAAADGAVTRHELDYLERVSDLLGLSPLTFRRLRDESLGVARDDPYTLLEVAPDATDEMVRAAWRRLLSRHHPDRAAGEGLGSAEVAAAERRATAINAAYETVLRERRALVSAA